jgi:hypothetical protein
MAKGDFQQQVTKVQGLLRFSQGDTGIEFFDYPEETNPLRVEMSIADLIPYNLLENGAVVEMEININVRQLPKRTKPDYCKKL